LVSGDWMDVSQQHPNILSQPSSLSERYSIVSRMLGLNRVPFILDMSEMLSSPRVSAPPGRQNL
jgi:hypothetical protein